MNFDGPLDIDTLSARMLRDYDSHDPGTVFGEGLRLTVEQAWELQDAVTRLREARGETVAGYKIGCVCAGNQQRLGLPHPAWGRLWSTEQYADGAHLKKADFANVAIEGEFAITLNRDIPAGGVTLEQIAAATERVVPVIELHNLVFRGEDPKGGELLANNAIHAGVVRGVGANPPAAGTTTDLSIRFDGELIDEWSDIRWPDDTLQAVPWFLERLAKFAGGLERGQTILTGALGPPLPVVDVHHVHVDSSGYGSVEAWFE